MKKLLFSAIASTFVAGLVSIPASASAAVINFANSDFATLNGTVDNGASTLGTLNQTPPFSGFGGFFTASFVSLGALNANTIPLSNGGNNNVAQSTTPFNLSPAEASSPLSFAFNFAYGGSTSLTPDNFRALVVDVGGAIVPAASLPPLNLSSSTNFLTTQNNFNFVYAANTFTAGSNYFLQFVLNENFDGPANNTAGGFNNVSVTTNVPFEFSPALGVLGLAGLFGANQFRKKIAKRKQVDAVNSIG